MPATPNIRQTRVPDARKSSFKKEKKMMNNIRYWQAVQYDKD